MNHQDTQGTRHQTDTRADRSAIPSADLTPMERWAKERAAEQPWNALASKTNTNSRGYTSDRGTSSTRGQNGSVGAVSN
ncbi:hypothetical protein N431DRAFT_502843 [Stipitochalara longipes BDJ]|nr:hypothetical protein N431DRAFT_502843 [Stipitochalara longipes BDJ]